MSDGRNHRAATGDCAEFAPLSVVHQARRAMQCAGSMGGYVRRPHRRVPDIYAA
jgi:hypothetical protein